MAVAITQVDRVARVEDVIALDRVLILAVIGDRVGGQVTKSDRVGPRTAGYRAREREEIVERTQAVDLEVFDAERIRDAKFPGREPRDAHVADRVRPLDVL